MTEDKKDETQKIPRFDFVERLREKEDFMKDFNAYKNKVNGGIDFLEKLENKYIGNNKKVNQLIEVLEMKDNPVAMLLADEGEGKTTTVKHLMDLVNYQRVTGGLNMERYYVIIKISVSHLAGLGLDNIQGVMEELLGEVKILEDKARMVLTEDNLRFCLFFDEAHKIVRIFGTQDKRGGDLLKESLTPAKVRVITATTRDEYDKTFASDLPLDNRFEIVELDRVKEENLVTILKSDWKRWKENPPIWEELGDVTDELLINIIRRAELLFPNKHEPRRSERILERLEAKCRLSRRQPSWEVVQEIFEERRQVVKADLDIYSAIENYDERILGQDLAKLQLKRYFGSLLVEDLEERKNRPIGVALFVGPTGVGKTETAYFISESLLKGSEILFVDCPSYANTATGARDLANHLGSAVYHNGNYTIVFDEFEKGVPSPKNPLVQSNLMTSFLQYTGEGMVNYYRLDGDGQMVETRQSLKGTFMIFTSNAGYESSNIDSKYGADYNWEEMNKSQKQARLGNYENQIRESLLVNDKLSPEFLNRMQVIVSFEALTEYAGVAIAKKLLNKFYTYLEVERGIELDLAPEHTYHNKDQDGSTLVRGAPSTFTEQELAVFIGSVKSKMTDSSRGGARQIERVIKQEIKGVVGETIHEYMKLETNPDKKPPETIKLEVLNHGIPVGIQADEFMLYVTVSGQFGEAKSYDEADRTSKETQAVTRLKEIENERRRLDSLRIEEVVSHG